MSSEPRWVLLIYTVPAEPSRLRATIWRELKKVGAPYLRDGVCILPHRPSTLEAIRAIAARVEEFGGEATLVQEARLEAARADSLIEQFGRLRAAEYADVGREAERLLDHVAHETQHREFTYAELEELEADLGKLRRWADQIQARDYFGTGLPQGLMALLERCDEALSVFLDRAAAEEGRL
jgi:hypothetical protein